MGAKGGLQAGRQALSTEELIQNGEKGGQDVNFFSERELHGIKPTFWPKVDVNHQKIDASHEEQTSPFILLVLF